MVHTTHCPSLFGFQTESEKDVLGAAAWPPNSVCV